MCGSDRELKNITKLFDYLIENSYQNRDISSKLNELDDYLDNNPQVTDCTRHNIQNLYKTDSELYLRFMKYSIEKSLYNLEMIFLIDIILHSKCFRDISESITCRRIFENTVRILLNCKPKEYIDISLSSDKFKVGIDHTISINHECLQKTELIGLLNILKDKYADVLIRNIENIDENEIDLYIRKLNKTHDYLKSCSPPFSLLSKLNYSEKNAELLFYDSDINPYEYDAKMYNIFNILLLPHVTEIIVLSDKLTFTNEGHGILNDGILAISYHGKQLGEWNLEEVKAEGQGTVYLDMGDVINHCALNSTVSFKIKFRKFNKTYTLIFQYSVGKLIEKIKDESGEPMTIYNINGNHANVNVGGTNVIQSQSGSINEQLLKLIQLLKENREYETCAEELGSAQKSADQNRIKAILTKLKGVAKYTPYVMNLLSHYQNLPVKPEG